MAALLIWLPAGACQASTPAPRPEVRTPVSFPARTAFPSAVSANHRYLLDQHGDAYLMVGDSPQCMAANVAPGDMDYFFADRQARGFNTMWTDILCGPYTGGRGNYSTYDGIVPFTTPGNLSTPNPRYFARIDSMVQLAESHGMTLLLQPAETGTFRSLLRSNGAARDFDYGAFIGGRYGKFPNIIWLSGNDYQTDQWAAFDKYTTALARGLRSTDPSRLQTVELDYPVSLSTDDPAWAALVNVNTAYTYAPTYAEVLKGYDRAPTMPVFMIEANYEGENNTGGPPTTDLTLRSQEYWTALGGATGQLYGNHYTWSFQDGPWKARIDTAAVTEVGYMVRLLESVAWYDLVPDENHRLMTNGYGQQVTTGHVSDSTYATAAMTADGSLSLVYLPTVRGITVDMSRFGGPVAGRWYDPTNGTDATIAGSPFANSGSHVFRPNGQNGAGDPDWVLVLTSPSRSR
jgi:Protein of unknown function (DUF4038)/Putative collagen-binding domain of a collagenase